MQIRFLEHCYFLSLKKKNQAGYFVTRPSVILITKQKKEIYMVPELNLLLLEFDEELKH